MRKDFSGFGFAGFSSPLPLSVISAALGLELGTETAMGPRPRFPSFYRTTTRIPIVAAGKSA